MRQFYNDNDKYVMMLRFQIFLNLGKMQIHIRIYGYFIKDTSFGNYLESYTNVFAIIIKRLLYFFIATTKESNLKL